MLADYQRKINQYIEEHLPHYQSLALIIHQRPEVSNYEFFACQTLSNLLIEEGFELEKEAASHRTGFAAYYNSHKPGPTLAFLAEYDALEGIGHACGHNLFGIYSVLAATSLKQVIDQTGGKICVYGTPGEEGGEQGSAKGSFVRLDYFQTVDAALCAHPGFGYSPTTTSLANDPVDIEFWGKASHAAAAPEKGINALEALIQTFVAINALRLQLPKDVNIHGIITNGGQAANVIPDYASARFYLRAKNRQTLDQVSAKVQKIVDGIALATGTQSKMALFQNAVDDTIVTPEFDQVFIKHLIALGLSNELINSDSAVSKGSSDVGNVSYVVPTIQPTVSISDETIPAHSLAFKEAAASPKGLASISVAARLLAYTGLDLLTNTDLLTIIKTNHQNQLHRGN